MAAIEWAHQMRGVAWEARHPAIRDTLAGILRQHGAPQRPGEAQPQQCPVTLAGQAGVTGGDQPADLGGADGGGPARRRAVLAAVHREHLTFTAEGMKLLIPWAMEVWLRVSDCRYGPVFRKIDCWGSIETAALHPYALPKILAKHVARAGCYGRRDFGEVDAHWGGVAMGQDESRSLALLAADGTEDVGRGRALILRRHGPGAAPGPAPGDLVLLAHMGLIGVPDL